MDETPAPPRKKGERPITAVTSTRTSRTPKKESTAVQSKVVTDKDAMKESFMSSPHVSWTPFAQSVGLDPVRSRQEFASQLWIQEKKQRIALKMADEIADLAFNQKGNWHRDVLNTVKRYPASLDKMFGILEYKMYRHSQMMGQQIANLRQYEEDKTKAATLGIQPPPPPQTPFDDIKQSDLTSLASAMESLTASKMKSLMLDGWTVKVSEDYVEPKTEEGKAESTEWKISVMGGESMTAKQMENLFAEYVDGYGNNNRPESWDKPVITTESTEIDQNEQDDA